MPLPFCVYILFSQKDFLLYIGYTTNLSKRVQTHNAGGNISTANRIPLDLIFCEFYLFEADARKRESYFKTNMGKKAIKLMLRSTLETFGYKGSLKNLKIEIDPVAALLDATVLS
jgi:putative endonuclease